MCDGGVLMDDKPQMYVCKYNNKYITCTAKISLLNKSLRALNGFNNTAVSIFCISKL